MESCASQEYGGESCQGLSILIVFSFFLRHALFLWVGLIDMVWCGVSRRIHAPRRRKSFCITTIIFSVTPRESSSRASLYD